MGSPKEHARTRFHVRRRSGVEWIYLGSSDLLHQMDWHRNSGICYVFPRCKRNNPGWDWSLFSLSSLSQKSWDLFIDLSLGVCSVLWPISGVEWRHSGSMQECLCSFWKSTILLHRCIWLTHHLSSNNILESFQIRVPNCIQLCIWWCQ